MLIGASYPHFKNTAWLINNKQKTVMGGKTSFQPPQNVYEFELGTMGQTLRPQLQIGRKLQAQNTWRHLFADPNISSLVQPKDYRGLYRLLSYMNKDKGSEVNDCCQFFASFSSIVTKFISHIFCVNFVIINFVTYNF